MPKWRKYRPAPARVLDLNTHIGLSIANGTLRALVARYSPDVILLQEVRRKAHSRDVRAVRNLLGKGWRVHGVEDSIVAYRTDRFAKRLHFLKRNSLGERHARYVAGVCVKDRLTGRLCWFQSVHVQPLGRGLSRGSLGAVRRQYRQLLGYAVPSGKRPRRHVVIDGGDFNQDLDGGAPKPRRKFLARRIWQRHADMVGAWTLDRHPGPVSIDGFFVRPDWFLSVGNRVHIPTVRRGDDHPAYLLTVWVKPRLIFKRK